MKAGPWPKPWKMREISKVREESEGLVDSCGTLEMYGIFMLGKKWERGREPSLEALGLLWSFHFLAQSTYSTTTCPVNHTLCRGLNCIVRAREGHWKSFKKYGEFYLTQTMFLLFTNFTFTFTTSLTTLFQMLLSLDDTSHSTGTLMIWEMSGLTYGDNPGPESFSSER